MTRKTDNIKNLASEKLGFEMLLEHYPKIVQPSLVQKKRILEVCNLPNLYLRSFDLLEMKVADFADVKSTKDFVLIEVKVTRKFLQNFPKGFFFGMTENEENLMRELGDSFLLCLVSVTESNFDHKFLNYEQLQTLIRTKRIQYQINL